ncbi:MAG: 1-deoxy-D-xylulose-5-phosphate reductoisomerase [Candidatus Fermentibacteraceae bacterium]
MKRRVAVLGSTGSIGVQALAVIEKSPSLILHSIYCGSSLSTLREQVKRFDPPMAGIAALPEGADGTGLVVGRENLPGLIEGADMVLNAIVGSAGLEASLLTQEAGVPLALANKESLVVGGDLLFPHLEKGLVIPVDSEHSTVFRCIAGEDRTPRRIVLTASGGALRDMPVSEIAGASVERVLSHPNWSMGARITVDSASMVNKAFEVIEARRLFPGIPIEVVVHPESIVHSFIETADGAWKALMGVPDMGVPISYALHWRALDIPEASDGDHPLSWGALHFSPMDLERYPAYTAVLSAYDTGGTAPAAANAADEEAVKAFLSKKIPFGAISGVIAGVLKRFNAVPVTGFDVLKKADSIARQLARDVMEEM